MRHLLGLRAAGGKLKVQHHILEPLRPVLEKVCEQDSRISTIIPGSIKPVASAHGKEVRVRVTIPIANGFKIIAQTSGARQELFVSTTSTLTPEQLLTAFREAGAVSY